MRETVFGLNAARFPVTDGNVMYDGIERAEPIDLFRDVPYLCDACQVADCDRAQRFSWAFVLWYNGPRMFAEKSRQDPKNRRRLSGPALRTFFRITEGWRLTVADQRALLGWPRVSTFYKYKAGGLGTLPYDTLVRILLVIGIYKALHTLYPANQLADEWIKLPNSTFGGRTPLWLMKLGIDGLHRVRRLLDGRRAGNH